MAEKKNVYQVILNRRSIRRFIQKPLPLSLLEQMVDAARVAPSAANLQPLEYLIVTEKNLCKKVFQTLSWAGYLKPRWTPAEHEQPMAYILILTKIDGSKYEKWDIGLSAENIILVAEDNNIGSCMLLKINRKKLREIFKIPAQFEIDSIIALGYKAEHPVVEERDDTVKYWRDENDLLHVPKRNLKNILHINKF